MCDVDRIMDQILAQRKIPVDLHFLHHRHKAGGARRKSINRSINSTLSPRGKARLEAVERGSEGLSSLCGTQSMEGKRGGWWLVRLWGWLVRFASKVCFQLTFSVDPTFWVGETRVFKNEKAFSRDLNALTLFQFQPFWLILLPWHNDTDFFDICKLS